MQLRIKKIIKQLDVFGQPVLLSYKNSTKYKTSFGGILTFLLILLVIAMSIESFQTLTSREKIYTSTSTLSELNPIEQTISLKEGFYFTFGFNPDIYNSWTRSIFTFSLDQRKYKRFKNGTRYLSEERNIGLEPCTSEHFPKDYDFEKYGQKGWLCPPKNASIRLKGQYESDEFDYVRLSVSKCKSSPNRNITCMSAEELQALKQKLTNDDGKIYLKMAISSNIFNMESFHSPVMHYLDTSGFFLIDQNNSFRSVDVFIKHNTVISDYNLLFSDKKERVVPSFSFYREQSTTLTGDLYASIYLRSAMERGLHTGVSEKLTIIMANFGGLVSMIYGILVILAKFVNRKRLLISLSNFLYDFEISPKDDDKKDDEKKDVAIPIIQVENLNHAAENQKTQDDSMKGSDIKIFPQPPEKRFASELPEADHVDKEKVRFKFNQFVRSFHKMKMSILTIFSLFVCPKRNKNKKAEKLALCKKAFKKVERDMDVMQIIKNVKEIEKLKSFLFDEHQKVIFEFFPRGIIRKKDGQKIKRKANKIIKKPGEIKSKLLSDFLRKLVRRKHSLDSKDHPWAIYFELFSAYEFLTKTEGFPRKEDAKLLSLLGQDTLKLIKGDSEA